MQRGLSDGKGRGAEDLDQRLPVHGGEHLCVTTTLAVYTEIECKMSERGR
jgi:hypothetical protein